MIMKKQLTSKTVYEPNESVKVTVTNKPVLDESVGQIAGYATTIDVKIKRPLMPGELKFSNDDDIAEFMAQVNFDDPQQSLGV